MEKGNTMGRDLKLLLLGRGVSDLGASIQMIVMPLFLLDLGGSATVLGLFSALSMATILVYPFAGALGDRVNRKKIMVVTDFASAAVLLLLFLSARLSFISFPLLLLGQLIVSVLNGIFDPATKGMIPKLARTNELSKANSMISAIRTLAVLFGAVIGTVLYAKIGIQWLFLLNGASFFLSACSEQLIAYEHKPQKGNAPGIIGQLREAVQFLLKTPFILWLCVYFFASLALILPIYSIVIPVLFRGSLNYSDGIYAVLQASMVIGALGGSIFVGRRWDRTGSFRRQLLLGCGALNGSLLIFVFLLFPFVIQQVGSASALYFSALTTILCLLSGSLTLIHIPVQTYIQNQTPDAYMSRIFAVVGMISKGGTPFGALCYGIALEWLPVHCVMVVSAVLTVLISVWLLTSCQKSQKRKGAYYDKEQMDSMSKMRK